MLQIAFHFSPNLNLKMWKFSRFESISGTTDPTCALYANDEVFRIFQFVKAISKLAFAFQYFEAFKKHLFFFARSFQLFSLQNAK